MSRYFNSEFIKNFWNKETWATEQYQLEPFTNEVLLKVEKKLGYKLPCAYVELMEHQNGGAPNNCDVPWKTANDTEIEYLNFIGLYGIGDEKPTSLIGENGSRFLIEEWGYPNIGVYFADTLFGFHEMLALDYRNCGPSGNPKVVHVDQEANFRITILADSFEAFIKSLTQDPEANIVRSSKPKGASRLISYGFLGMILLAILAAGFFVYGSLL